MNVGHFLCRLYGLSLFVWPTGVGPVAGQEIGDSSAASTEDLQQEKDRHLTILSDVRNGKAMLVPIEVETADGRILSIEEFNRLPLEERPKLADPQGYHHIPVAPKVLAARIIAEAKTRDEATRAILKAAEESVTAAKALQARIEEIEKAIAQTRRSPVAKDAEQDDLEALQGRWVCVATFKDDAPVQNFVGVKAIIMGNSLTWIFRNADGRESLEEARFTIDPSQKHFDWYYVSTSPEKMQRRLYAIDGDRMCFADNFGQGGRPGSFEKAVWRFECQRLGSPKPFETQESRVSSGQRRVNVAHGAQVIGGSGDYGDSPFNTGGVFATNNVTDGENATDPTNSVGDISEPDQGGSYWLGRQAEPTGYFILDLGGPQTIGEVVLFNTRNGPYNDRGTGDFTIKASNKIAPSRAGIGMDLVAPHTIVTGRLTPQTYSGPFNSQGHTALVPNRFFCQRSWAVSISAVRRAEHWRRLG